MREPATFRCRQCGACCRAPGYVALERGEPEAIAAFLGLDVYAFTEACTALTPNRRDLTLLEQADGRCLFLQDDNTCRIQPVKPAQCRGFPFLWRTPRLEQACAALAGDPPQDHRRPTLRPEVACQRVPHNRPDHTCAG